ncbi:MAG: PEP-CTERM sorting domain-containing protein [Thermoguttaceae bacterium]|nr:PEP-CTERM sorting domain-containing protein [Thermoguttaceae bacterium]
MSKNRYDFVFRFASMLTIGLFVLTSSVTAEVVERYNAAGDLTASGTDVGAVQKSTDNGGPVAGDVIKISGTATQATSYGDPITKFTIQSTTPGTKQTINAGNTRLYNYNDGAKTYDITLTDLDFQGYPTAVGNAIGLYMHTSPACTLDMKMDNVSFTGFKNAGYHGGVFGLDGSGNLKITATNGLVFDSNRSNASTGGAIHVNAGSLTITADTLTFKNNYAKTYGGAIKAASGTITAGTLLFDGNNTSNNDAGAIYASGSFTINGSSADAVTTVNNNYTKYKGGAIRCDGTLTLQTGTFNITNNYNKTSSDKYSYGGAVHAATINTDAKTINFDSNKSTYYGGGLSVNGGTLKADTIIFNKNTSSNRGGAIFTNGSLTITGNTIKFTDNFANNFGGAIFNNNGSSTLTITGKDVLFSGNHVSGNDGGTIHGGNVTLNGVDANSVFTFDKNYTKYFAAAINTGAVTLNTGTFNFTNNYETASSGSYSYGGAIHCSSISTNAKEIKFDSNTSRYYGGALSVSGSGGTIQADTITFNKNKADLFGGSIHLNGGTLTITGDDVKFTDNSVTSANGDGGAIRGVNNAAVVFTGLDEESAMLFSGNTSTRYGGALSVSYITLSTGTFTFENNSTGNLGGAMYAATVTFSGDGTVGTFTGNSAEVGNDIYFFDANSVLTFQNAGTYSFDGGIYMDSETAQTVINQAQVTIAGREGDDTNVYQLQNVSISNGGKLTAELDNINSATGTFTLDDSSVLEFKTDSADASRFDNAISGGTLLKTGSGTLALDGTDEHPITANSLTAEDGSLLFKGYYTGDLTIKDGTLFSPGNSVGTLTMDGNFTAESGSTLLFEQDATGIDQLIILNGGTIDIANDAILQLAMTSPVPGATYTLIDSPDGLTGEYASDEFWNGLLTPASAYAWNLYVDGGILYASIDSNAVPEPSTWALLALGVIVLYLRKRVRS